MRQGRLLIYLEKKKWKQSINTSFGKKRGGGERGDGAKVRRENGVKRGFVRAPHWLSQ